MTTDTDALNRRIAQTVWEVCAGPFTPTISAASANEVAIALAPTVAEEVRKAKAEALREEADRISRLANEPQLIECADKYAGYYAGIRAALQNEVQSVRARATEYETGDSDEH